MAKNTYIFMKFGQNMYFNVNFRVFLKNVEFTQFSPDFPDFPDFPNFADFADYVYFWRF